MYQYLNLFVSSPEPGGSNSSFATKLDRRSSSPARGPKSSQHVGMLAQSGSNSAEFGILTKEVKTNGPPCLRRPLIIGQKNYTPHNSGKSGDFVTDFVFVAPGNSRNCQNEVQSEIFFFFVSFRQFLLPTYSILKSISVTVMQDTSTRLFVTKILRTGFSKPRGYLSAAKRYPWTWTTRKPWLVGMVVM